MVSEKTRASDPEVAALSVEIHSLTARAKSLLDDIDATVVMLKVYEMQSRPPQSRHL